MFVMIFKKKKTKNKKLSVTEKAFSASTEGKKAK